jgi:shikimate kinase
MNNSISLIGMAGAGKSSIGKKLAKHLNFNFVDSDLIIEKKYGESLQDILNQKGNKKFKEIEEGALLSVEFKEIVLATGGSAVFCDAAMDYIKDNSIVIYLEVSYEDISARISNFSERGLLKRSDQTIQEAYKEREGLYQNCADYIVQNNEKIDSCLNKIFSLIKTF